MFDLTLQNPRESSTAPLDAVENVFLGSNPEVTAEDKRATDAQDNQYNNEPEWQCMPKRYAVYANLVIHRDANNCSFGVTRYRRAVQFGW